MIRLGVDRLLIPKIHMLLKCGFLKKEKLEQEKNIHKNFLSVFTFWQIFFEMSLNTYDFWINVPKTGYSEQCNKNIFKTLLNLQILK